LDGERVVDVRGDPENPHNRGRTCVKGKFSPRILHSPDRVLKPLIRDRKAGESSFREISWDGALNEIAERLSRIAEKHGPRALAIYQGKSTRFIDRAFISAFARLIGTPNVTGVWSFCVGPKIVGYRATFGPPLFPRCDFENARLILLWGTNPAVSRMHRYLRVYDDITAAKKRGAKLVVIDPRVHRTAQAAHVHLALNPGTDTYLALGLVKLLVENGWVDRDFIARYAQGFDRLCDSLADLSLAEVASRTGLPAARIHDLARDLGTLKPASIDRREGTIHVANGTQLNRALAILAAVTGNVDVPGGLTFQPGIRWDTSLGVAGSVEDQPFWQDALPLAQDGTGLLPDTILTGRPYPVRGLISVAGNPVAMFPDTAKTVRALEELDLLVVNDLFLTETARLADIVLPGVTFFEKGELETGPFKLGQWIKATEPVLPPRGEALPEWKFFARLAQAMGCDELSGYDTEDDVLRRVFSDSGLPELDPAGLRRGRLLKPVTHGELLRNGFQTASGEIELYSEWLEAAGYAPLPRAEDVCETTPEYPFRLTTGERIDAFNHSQHRNVPELRRLCPHPRAEISGDLARRLGVAEGDGLQVNTARGSLRILATVVEGMNPSTISIPHGWEGGSNVNRLLGDDRCDPIAGTPAFKAVPCQIRRTTGASLV
jgi:anaerobic selenocysteine-containing dehydrogenase